MPLCLPHPASAQTEITARGASIQLGGRLQAQYSTSSIDAATQDFFFRRVRLIADVTLNDFVSGRVQPDFVGGTANLQDAYVRLTFSDAFRLSMGQFKRSFDLFDLSSSTDLSIIERDGRVEGLDVCTGVGGICSHARFAETLRLAGRDQGIKIDGSTGAVTYEVSVTNGTGSNTADENDAKSFSGRATVAATEDVRLSGKLALHDYVDPAGENATAVAFGVDAELGTWRDGLHVQASAMSGDNWLALDASNTPATFLAFQAVASFYHPLDGDRIVGVEPILRLSLGDPDNDVSDDGGTLLTPGLMFYFGGRNKIGANLDVYSPQGGDSEFSFKVQTFLYF
jgi:hypothetical protein